MYMFVFLCACVCFERNACTIETKRNVRFQSVTKTNQKWKTQNDVGPNKLAAGAAVAAAALERAPNRASERASRAEPIRCYVHNGAKAAQPPLNEICRYCCCCSALAPSIFFLLYKANKLCVRSWEHTGRGREKKWESAQASERIRSRERTKAPGNCRF